VMVACDQPTERVRGKVVRVESRVVRAFIGHAIRAVKIVVRDGRIPRPLRWGGALGFLPVPGPFDEFVLLAVGGILWLFYREQLADAWREAGGVSPGLA
jgi:hypothetical protein